MEKKRGKGQLLNGLCAKVLICHCTVYPNLTDWKNEGSDDSFVSPECQDPPVDPAEIQTLGWQVWGRGLRLCLSNKLTLWVAGVGMLVSLPEVIPLVKVSTRLPTQLPPDPKACAFITSQRYSPRALAALKVRFWWQVNQRKAKKIKAIRVGLLPGAPDILMQEYWRILGTFSGQRRLPGQGRNKLLW